MIGMPMEDEKVTKRLSSIKHKILVLSGKGGVGKSTVAVNLAAALAVAGKRVGLLDIDVHGPSVPKLLGVEGMSIHGTEDSLHPFGIGENLRVMSIGFLLRNTDDAVIWRGPMKIGVIKQFLGDVEWGELDYLVVDSPPGTGDEPLTIAQLIKDVDGAIIVTTPQEIALIDVRKCITFCRQVGIPVLGIVENMSGFICPECGTRTDIFKRGGGGELAGELGVPLLGQVPVDPGIVSASDEGKPYVLNFPETGTGKIFAAIVAPILGIGAGGGIVEGKRGTSKTRGKMVRDARSGGERPTDEAPKSGKRRGGGPGSAGAQLTIALPVTEGMLSRHFGHCERFALFEVERDAGQIVGTRFVEAPPHQPGLLPEWLKERGADMIIACGMGQRAKSLFAENGIEVIVGAPFEKPESVVEAFLAGTLTTGENICDH
jgi:Mrp family chromosome partitioning ATPase/predicted Fe-Mo cluster-binding NifX family protein